MSCLEASLTRLGKPMTFSVERLGKRVSFSTERVGTTQSFELERLWEKPQIEAHQVQREFAFRCGLVCSLSAGLHLRVPQEQIWLLPENGFSEDVVVYANVSWTIE